MNLVPWKSKSERNGGRVGIETAMARLRQDMDELFTRFLGRGTFDFGAPWGGAFGPRVDMVESDKDITVTAELPGVDPKDIDIHVTGNTVSIRGEKKHSREEKGADYQCCERQFGVFQRTLQLPNAVDPDKVNAHYKDGVLTVTVTKHPEAQPKRIAVKAG
jgi:HSP20 family protein